MLNQINNMNKGEIMKRRIRTLMIQKACLLMICFALSGCGMLGSNKTKVVSDIDISPSNQKTSEVTNGKQPTTELATTSKAKAWELGNKLSLAALLYDAKGITNSESLTFAKDLAKEMDIEIPDFPAKTGNNASDGAAILAYLLNDPGKTITGKIKAKYDQDHADFYEMSLKSNLLLMIYGPGEKEGTAIINVVKRNAARVKLPETYWQPLVKKVESSAPFDEVKDAVFDMQKDVSSYLETAK